VKRRRKDSGFAMLLVFLMAACIAITLYIEVPRVAFEAERQRELLLVDRGNQFKRAIQVFVTDKVNNPTRRYPASIEELENFNNHRYLRRRYLDPMTGKDEWRLVHINGGVLTDSVTTQGKNNLANGQPGSSTSTGSTYISTQAYMDVPTGDNGGAGGVNRALNRRPSDGAGAPGDPNNPGAPSGTPGDPNAPVAGGSGALPPAGGPGGAATPGSAGSTPGQNPSGIPPIPGLPGQVPGTASGTTDPSAQQPGGSSPGGMPAGFGPGAGTPGAPGNGQSSTQSAAAQLIGNLLTQPRPGGMPSGMPGATMGGGIAGVASKYESEGIMVINQRTKINEWEYIFDASKWRAPPNPVSGSVGNQIQPNGTGNNNSNGLGTNTTSPAMGNTPSPSGSGH
jgi:hypothetical protein